MTNLTVGIFAFTIFAASFFYGFKKARAKLEGSTFDKIRVFARLIGNSVAITLLTMIVVCFAIEFYIRKFGV